MTAAAARAGQSLWPAVATLLRLRLSILLRGLRRSTRRRKVGTIILVIVVLALLVGLFVASTAILRLMRSPELAQVAGDFGPLIQSIPTLLLGGAFLGILLTSFGVLLQALYLAGDMDFLLSAPIPLRAVFVSKLLQAILPNLGVIALFGLPLLFGSGRGRQVLLGLLPDGGARAGCAGAGGGRGLQPAGHGGRARRAGPEGGRSARVPGRHHFHPVLPVRPTGQLRPLVWQSSGRRLRLVSQLDVPWSPLSWAGRGCWGSAAGSGYRESLTLGLCWGSRGGVLRRAGHGRTVVLLGLGTGAGRPSAQGAPACGGRARRRARGRWGVFCRSQCGRSS